MVARIRRGSREESEELRNMSTTPEKHHWRHRDEGGSVPVPAVQLIRRSIRTRNPPNRLICGL